ncbi:hypothetical protein BD770DRAFT_308862, partial [Pilaira anomala]
IHISEDPSTGYDQDLKRFWGRILEDFNKYNLYGRFKTIQKQVSGYCGRFSQAKKTMKSGAN